MPYGYLEIYHLLGKRGHFVVEAKSIFPALAGCEHEVSLSLFGPFHDDLLIGPYN